MCEAREKFSSANAPFRSRLPLNHAAARKTTKEPVSFLIVAVINKAKDSKNNVVSHQESLVHSIFFISFIIARGSNEPNELPLDPPL